MTDYEDRLPAWFLGPKAENAEILERLVLEALRDSVFWRRNFHPEDEALITERMKRGEAYEDTLSTLNQEFLSLLADLKRGIPTYSPRYVGHMLSDQLLPAIAAYFAAMLHNPNNVSTEGGATTTTYEIQVARQLADLVGYGENAWGHITSGGTVANIESLWVARNLKLLPLAARRTARELGLEGIPVPLPAGDPGGPGATRMVDDEAPGTSVVSVDLADCDDAWALLNLSVDVAAALPDRIRDAAAEKGISSDEVARLLNRFSVSGMGVQGFFSELGADGAVDSTGTGPAAPTGAPPSPGVVITTASAHYSIKKAVEALGIGTGRLRALPVDPHFRIDIPSLRTELERCLEERIPVYAVIAVVGSTEEGAVDEVHEIADLRDEFARKGLNFFLHCDAAWGGYARTLFLDADDEPVEDAGDIVKFLKLWPPDRVFESFRALHRTDSLTVDPHKLGYIPYPCGTVLFRNRRVRDLITFDAPYIFELDDGGSEHLIGRHILEGSKPGAAAAACWFAHRIVPLNQSGYGALIGKSIQSAQELYLKLARDLPSRLEEAGATLRVLTDPPDLNLVCFVVNRVGNSSLERMNRLNRAVYERLRFHDDQVMQGDDFMLSSTVFEWDTYGKPGGDGRSCVDGHLEAVGVAPDEFREVGRMRILRCTIMSPWFDISRGGRPDYVQEFCASLERVIAEALEETASGT
ncbi:MAG: pyridoxal-dependent decarboxylase [Longimicrobiales bacterium]|nr:pyridoxal-dependent decarboxylase [Longimicrobiales bacterium]